MKNINLQVGMTAVEVALKIVKVNGLGHFTVVVYNTHKEPRQPFSVESWLRHSDRTKEKIIELRVDKTTTKDIEDITNNIGKEMAVGLISAVTVLNNAYHIPLMDFNCQFFDENDVKILREFLHRIGERQGAILASGRSYHYYGVELIHRVKWPEFLGKCLLFKNYIGQRYVGHCLIDGYATLRLSTNERRPFVPKVVEVI